MSAEESTQLILLSGILGVLVVILVILGSISRSLIRMERRTGQPEVANTATGSTPAAGRASKKISQHADFLTFLSEDSTRRTLPKREQFAAYRKWRKENGLSWPQSPENQSEK